MTINEILKEIGYKSDMMKEESNDLMKKSIDSFVDICRHHDETNEWIANIKKELESLDK